jgi:uncharacterized protein YxeA
MKKVLLFIASLFVLAGCGITSSRINNSKTNKENPDALILKQKSQNYEMKRHLSHMSHASHSSHYSQM